MNSGLAPLLVVDDEEANCDLLARRLRRSGYEVITAQGGAEALKVLRSREIEMVLLDIMMPGMTGVDLLKLLRSTHQPSQLPVIMVSALSDSQAIVEALACGANDYVTKPVDFPVTLARIESQLKAKRAQQRLRENQERYSRAELISDDGLWEWNAETGAAYLSPRWKAMIGYDAAAIGDELQQWLERVHPGDRAAVDAEFARLVTGGEPDEFRCEYRIAHKDGGYRWMTARASVEQKAGAKPRFTGSQSDITKPKTTDALTGLANRFGLLDEVERAITDAQAGRSPGFAVVLLGLDRFKVINEGLGHDAGDGLLISVARRLESCTAGALTGSPLKCVLARTGGDEFAVMLAPCADPAEAQRVVEAVLDSMREPHELKGHNLVCSGTVGICLGDGASAPADLLRDAGTALIQCKKLSRCRSMVFGAEMHTAAKNRLELELDLERAIDRNEFIVHYQPKIRLSSGELTGFEALVRWQHPVRGMVPPGDFIRVAEETGKIHAIGLRVLRESCKKMRQWRESFRLPLSIAVNLSARQLQQPLLAQDVADALAETGLPPEALSLEVTESMLVDRQVIGTIERLREMRVGLEIDDFGTGYSSLSYLHTLPFDGLKIDKSFLERVVEPTSRAEVVEAMLQLASGLGMGVTAEGVETAQQLAWLRAVGCESGQGFFFARPMAGDQVPAYIRSTLAKLAGGLER